jgi:hypothetical protein
VEEFSAVLKSYGITSAQSDHWGGDWVLEAFRKKGITVSASAKVKSDIYRELLPLLNAGRVDLIDNARLVTQMVGLERRVSRSGKDSIDHAPGGHDDVANAAAGALLRARTRVPMQISQATLDGLRAAPSMSGGVGRRLNDGAFSFSQFYQNRKGF